MKMIKQRVTTPSVSEPSPGMFSNCLRVGDFVYISGQVAPLREDETTGESVEVAQTRLIFEKIKALMTAAGGSMDDIVKLTIFLTDIDKRTDIWAVRKTYFSGDFPTCSMVEVSALASPDMRVEIEAWAHLGCSPA